MRQITIGIDSILELISCGSDYGFENEILYDAFSEILGTLSDEEIESYAKHVMNTEGYDIEDYEEIKERLPDFRKTYIKQNNTP